MPTIHVFVSYSHRDESWVQEGTFGLIPWLAQQVKKNEVEIWQDHALKQLPGTEYRKLIKSEIDRAHMAILLISQDFVTSDFIQKYELPWIRERVERGELSLIPILVGTTDEDDLGWLADRQMMPGKPTPLIEYTESTPKWQAVRVEILKAIRKSAREIADRLPVASSPQPAPATQDLIPESLSGSITTRPITSSSSATTQPPQPQPASKDVSEPPPAKSFLKASSTLKDVAESTPVANDVAEAPPTATPTRAVRDSSPLGTAPNRGRSRLLPIFSGIGQGVEGGDSPRRSFVILAGLVVVHIVLGITLVCAIIRWDYGGSLLLTLGPTQATLIALWAALGGGRFLWRVPPVVLGTIFFLACCVELHSFAFSKAPYELLLVSIAQLAVMPLLLSVVRLAGVQLVNGVKARRMTFQVAIRNTLAWMAVLVVIITAKLHSSYREESLSYLFTPTSRGLAIVGAFALVGGSALFCALGRRWLFERVLVVPLAISAGRCY